LERLWDCGQGSLESERLRALCYEYRGEWETAADIWQWLADQQPFEADHHRGLGRVAVRRRQYRQAADAYENAYRLSLSPAIAAEVARLSLLAGRPERALEYAALAPPSPRVWLVKAHAHRTRKEYEKALAAMLAAHRLAAADDGNGVLNSAFFTLMGELYRQLGRVDEAVGALQQAIAKRPDNDEARLLLVVVNERAGRYEQALDRLQELLAEHPDNPLFHRHAGRLHQKQGDASLALARFRHAYELAPTPELAHELALALLNADHPDQALKLLESVPGGVPRALLEAHC
jgi:tetratricopeptide (TPR) repeat protein